MMDKEGHILFFNKASEQAFGYSRRDVLNKVLMAYKSSS
jgi:PAS domain S-box-containing protein